MKIFIVFKITNLNFKRKKNMLYFFSSFIVIVYTVSVCVVVLTIFLSLRYSYMVKYLTIFKCEFK